MNWGKLVDRYTLKEKCPRCRADPGKRCRTSSGALYKSDFHVGRWRKGRRASGWSPEIAHLPPPREYW